MYVDIVKLIFIQIFNGIAHPFKPGICFYAYKEHSFVFCLPLGYSNYNKKNCNRKPFEAQHSAGIEPHLSLNWKWKKVFKNTFFDWEDFSDFINRT